MEEVARQFWKPEWKVKEEYLERTDKKIADNEAMKAPDVVTIGNHTFYVHPGVFSSSIFIGTEFLSDRLTAFLPWTGTFLEIGCGCGCIDVIVAEQRPDLCIFAVDINPDALENTKRNLAKHGLSDRVTVRQSDVLGAFVGQTELVFDCIFWNFPFHHTQKALVELTMTERAIRDPYYVNVHKLFVQAKDLVTPDGTILLGFSKTMGIVEALVCIGEHHGWSVQERADGLDFAKEPSSMAIFECRRASTGAN